VEVRCAARETVRGRQQSCWQHPGGPWNSASWEGRPCIGFRMQQACAGVAEIARATGTNTPTSSRTSNNLAVKRCMSLKACLDGVERNRFQRKPKSLQLPLATGEPVYKHTVKTNVTKLLNRSAFVA
jgi:hypothetical protein